MGKRRLSREAAFQLHFSRKFTEVDRHRALSMHEMIVDEDARKPDEFSDRLLSVLEENEEDVEEALEDCLSNWSTDRLTMFDHALLDLAATELLYFEDVPPKVVINEYLEIAKNYGTEESPKFLNGVLDRLLKDLVPKSKVRNNSES